MSETREKPEDKMQQNIGWSSSKIGKFASNRRIGLLVGLLVVVCTMVSAAHWPALSAGALLFDDQVYLTENLLVQNPSWTSARRFLTEVLGPSTVYGYYQPLTMISLMLDYALGGRSDNLRPFHRTSLALHTANTALVIVLLYLLFGRAWIAAGVGLLFGVHPMTVESISWVADRKTLLAAFFALWCLILYVRFTRKSDWRLYVGCMVMYVLALMSKPTSLPLPALMLLLDYWPLRRLKRRAVLEKLPFFAVGGIAAIITYISQSRTCIITLPSEYRPEYIPLILCHNIIFYLYKMVWPVNLTSHYVYSEPLGLSNPMVMAGVIGTCILIPLLVISLRWTRGALTGWLIFFLAILPTMQIIGFSDAIASDKFAYLPSVGLLMALAAFLAWFCSIGSTGKLGVRRTAVVMTVLILAGAETVAARRYLVHWRDTVSLYEHMLTLTPDEAEVRNGLGIALEAQGKFDEAISHFRQVLEVKPDLYEVRNNLGNVLSAQGKFSEAISHYRQVLQLQPDNAKAHNNLGIALQALGKLDEAISHYRQALWVKPNSAQVHYNVGLALQLQGKLDEAISHYRRALQVNPVYALAYNNIGNALSAQGKFDEAISYYRQALRANPDYASAHNNLGYALQLHGKLDEAISHYYQVLEVEPNHARAHYNLGIALLAQGKLDEAISHFRKALQAWPNDVSVHNNLAWILATHPDLKMRDASWAIEFAERAAELTGYQNAAILDTLAAAYAAAGQFDRAVTTAQTALALASAAQNEELANHIRKQLELYKQAKPVRNSTNGKHPGKEEISNGAKP